MARHTPPVRQTDLEAATGIPQSTVSRLLKPTQPMTLDQFESICSALDVDPGLLLHSARELVEEHEAGRKRSHEDHPEQRRAEPSG